MMLFEFDERSRKRLLQSLNNVLTAKENDTFEHSNGAPDMKEALSARDLHVKSMQRRDRHPGRDSRE